MNMEKKAKYNLDEWLNIVQDKGAGEILINPSIKMEAKVAMI